MPTPRNGETREEFLARRRIYDRAYEPTKRKRTPTGKRVYTDEQKARTNAVRREKRALLRSYDSDLRNFQSYLKATRGKVVTPQVANWFRQGFHKVGAASDLDIRYRRLFLAWLYGYQHGRPTTISASENRADTLSRRQLETISGFDWVKWRADYKAFAEG